MAYSIFENQKDINNSKLPATNELLNLSGLKTKFNFSEITKIRVVEKLPEIEIYRNYLKSIFAKGQFHLYPDRLQAIKLKNQMPLLKEIQILI